MLLAMRMNKYIKLQILLYYVHNHVSFKLLQFYCDAQLIIKQTIDECGRYISRSKTHSTTAFEWVCWIGFIFAFVGRNCFLFVLCINRFVADFFWKHHYLSINLRISSAVRPSFAFGDLFAVKWIGSVLDMALV